MNEMNFDNLQNLNTPENWVENALNIPQEKKKAIIIPFGYTRTLSAVACLVLVLLLSVSLLSLTKNNATLKSDPQGPTAHVNNTEPTQNSESDSHTDNKNNKNNNKHSYNPILPDGVLQQVEDATQSTDDKTNNNKETIKPTQGNQHETNAPQKPTVAPSKPNDIEPTESAPPVCPTEPTEPDEPMIPGMPTEMEPVPTEGEIPEEPRPTKNPHDFEPQDIVLTIYASVPSSSTAGTKSVYCMLYDSNGAVVGNAYTYSQQRKCTKTPNGSTTNISYSPYYKGIYYKSGTYSYKFYTSSGKVIASGSTYLQNPFGD